MLVHVQSLTQPYVHSHRYHHNPAQSIAKAANQSYFVNTAAGENLGLAAFAAIPDGIALRTIAGALAQPTEVLLGGSAAGSPPLLVVAALAIEQVPDAQLPAFMGSLAATAVAGAADASVYKPAHVVCLCGVCLCSLALFHSRVALDHTPAALKTACYRWFVMAPPGGKRCYEVLPHKSLDCDVTTSRKKRRIGPLSGIRVILK